MASLPSNGQIVARYCVDCHNSEERVADLALDTLDPEHAATDVETWEKVIRKVRVGQMPKHDPNASRPDPTAAHEMTAALEKLTSSLEKQIDRLSGARPTPGRPLLGRLNRAEYANAIRDLFGLDVDASSLLPPDDSAYGFDNVADVLGTLLRCCSRYLTARGQNRRDGGGRSECPARSVPRLTDQQRSFAGTSPQRLPLGTVGGCRRAHVFPLDAEYDFPSRSSGTNLEVIRGLEYPHRLEIAMDGERVFTEESAERGSGRPQCEAGGRSRSTRCHRRAVACSVPVRPGPATSASRSSVNGRESQVGCVRSSASTRYVRLDGAPHVERSRHGPFDHIAAGETPSRRQHFFVPAGPTRARAACAENSPTLGAPRLSGSVQEAELARLMPFFERRARTAFRSGHPARLRRVLGKPLLRIPSGSRSRRLARGRGVSVTEYELATRLSFFLWSSIPDDELLARRRRRGAPQAGRAGGASPADAGGRRRRGAHPKLRRPVAASAEPRRHRPNSEQFPDFDHNLRQDFRREAELFFASMLHEDRSVLDLMTRRLHVRQRAPGPALRYCERIRQPLPASRPGPDARSRDGLLGKGGVAARDIARRSTSPSLRGKWLLENMLGTRRRRRRRPSSSAEKAEPGAAPKTMRARWNAIAQTLLALVP